MPNFNAVAHLVRPAERGQTDIQTDSPAGNHETQSQSGLVFEWLANSQSGSQLSGGRNSP